MMTTSINLSTEKKLGINGKFRRRLASMVQEPHVDAVQFKAETPKDKSTPKRNLEQHPFERHGKEALEFYAGIRDKDLRASLMKLFCWMREAQDYGLLVEYCRLVLVQVENMINAGLRKFPYHLKYESIDDHIRGIKSSWYEISNKSLSNLETFERAKIISFVEQQKSLENAKISFTVRLHMFADAYELKAEEVFRGNLKKTVYALRNTASHYSISNSSMRRVIEDRNSWNKQQPINSNSHLVEITFLYLRTIKIGLQRAY